MADKSFFGRLQTLFSTNTIVRKVGANKLRVIDVNKAQATNSLEPIDLLIGIINYIVLQQL